MPLEWFAWCPIQNCWQIASREDSLREIYGADIPQTLVSKITDKILPEVNEWQHRSLETIYPIIYFDGIVFKSRKDNQIINKCVYSVLGIDMDGHRDILGCWLSENEGASFYASICSDLKKRGVSDVYSDSVYLMCSQNQG